MQSTQLSLIKKHKSVYLHFIHTVLSFFAWWWSF